MQTKRLYFIDIIRAFAILMMLQGHFIDTLLADNFRDTSNIAFNIWTCFRGITAPTFFTISGLIFTYLLLKAKHKNEDILRMKKGLIRGAMLIGIGYLLRVPIFSWLVGDFNSYFLIIDVLQIIGLCLILIVLLYGVCFRHCNIFSILALTLGLLIFLTEPLYRNWEFEAVPLVFSNYLSKANGSVFTLLPWLGYMLIGAYIASVFYRHLAKPKFKPISIAMFFILGYLLIEKSSLILYYISVWTGKSLFLDVASYNYLFTRLGNVLIYFAVFYNFEQYLKLRLLLKIGQKTLSIYVIHFIIIYGSFTGLGLHQIIGKTLNPWQAILGAILFLSIVCFISFYYIKTNKYIYTKWSVLVAYVRSKN